jgi:hypothetical protein
MFGSTNIQHIYHFCKFVIKKKSQELFPTLKMKKPIALSKLLLYKYIIFFVKNKKKGDISASPD